MPENEKKIFWDLRLRGSHRIEIVKQIAHKSNGSEMWDEPVQQSSFTFSHCYCVLGLDILIFKILACELIFLRQLLLTLEYELATRVFKFVTREFELEELTFRIVKCQYAFLIFNLWYIFSTWACQLLIRNT